MQQAVALLLSDRFCSRWFVTSAMGAHQAALPFKTTLPAGDHLCAMTSHSGARLLHGDSVRMTCSERKRSITVGSTPIGSDATPARGDDDEPIKYHFYRQPAPGTWTTSFHKINQQLPLVNRNIAKSATTKTDSAGGMEEITTNENAEDGTELEYCESIYCDTLPRSLGFQFLHLASRICEEVDSELKLRKSKKPQRLSTTSWDLLE